MKSMLSPHELIVALTSLPAEEFAEVVSSALERRNPEPAHLNRDETTRRFMQRSDEVGDARSTPEVLVLKRFEVTTAVASQGAPSSAHGGCCGLTFTSHARQVFCPLCGKRVSVN